MSIILPNEKPKDRKEVLYTQVNSRNLLLIFTRNPELGKCKTRLAATIGDAAALEIYKFLLEHTATVTKNLTAAKTIYYSETIWEDDVWDNAIFSKKVQKGKDLGERMYHAFQAAFESGYEKVVIIGSDMYELAQSDLEDAFSALDKDDFVLGPAEDGGYYLLGMTSLEAPLFKDKDWGKETVLKDSLNNLKNKRVKILETKNDVDVYEDIAGIKVFQQFIKHVKNE